MQVKTGLINDAARVCQACGMPWETHGRNCQPLDLYRWVAAAPLPGHVLKINAAPAAQPKEDDMNEDIVRGIIDERLRELGMLPPHDWPEPTAKIEPHPAVGAVELALRVYLNVLEQRPLEYLDRLDRAIKHYFMKLEAHVDRPLADDEHLRCLGLALHHCVETRADQDVRALCNTLSSHLPTGWLKPEDVFEYVPRTGGGGKIPLTPVQP